jgi:hypothetical protein
VGLVLFLGSDDSNELGAFGEPRRTNRAPPRLRAAMCLRSTSWPQARDAISFNRAGASMEPLVTYPHSGQNGARGANEDMILAPLCRQITLPHRPIEHL